MNLEKNKKLVTEFVEVCYNHHNAEAAAHKYMKPCYIQHNPAISKGQQAFIKYFDNYMKEAPNLKATIYRIAAETIW